MKQDKKHIAELKDQARKFHAAQIKTAKTSQLLQPNFQATVEIQDDDRPLLKYSQDQLHSELPAENAQNVFDIALNNGPYRCSLTPQTVYLCGAQGHISAFNWRHKQLECEFDVKEKCRDIVAVAQRNFAVAQKNSVYIYDPKGVEVHKMRMSNNVQFLNYLPYHYLLASLSCNGKLVYQDLTQGKIIATYNTAESPRFLVQNQNSSVLAVGDALGVVRMYSPNNGQSLASIQCHKNGVLAADFTRDGSYLVTGGGEGTVKIWDLRTFKMLDTIIRASSLVNSLSVSERGVIGVGYKSEVAFFKDSITENKEKPYMRHHAKGLISQIAFIKHEDYMGVATYKGYEQIIVPESGDPFYDTFEDPEMQNKKQRREHNIRSLIEKLPPESITLNPLKIGSLDRASKEVIAREKKLNQDVQVSKKIQKQKKKMRGRSKGSKKELIKQTQKEQERQEKWQDIFSDALRARRAEKEKRKQELGILSKLEKMSAKDFIKAVN